MTEAISVCECDWQQEHQGKQCRNPAADYGPDLHTSPELCTVCLFVCCGEREDAEQK